MHFLSHYAQTLLADYPDPKSFRETLSIMADEAEERGDLGLARGLAKMAAKGIRPGFSPRNPSSPYSYWQDEYYWFCYHTFGEESSVEFEVIEQFRPIVGGVCTEGDYELLVSRYPTREESLFQIVVQTAAQDAFNGTIVPPEPAKREA